MTVLAGSNNAFGYRTDDHGNTTGAATVLTVSNNTISASGVISQTSDIDAFRFTTTGGTVSFTGSVAQYAAMLDMSLEIWNASGNVVATAATSSLGESLSATLSAGTYYIVVRSAGNYGDVGQYTLTGTLPGGSVTPPVANAGSGYTVAEGSSVVLSGAASTGTSLSYAWDLDGDGIFGETGANAIRGNETGVSPTFLASGLDGPSTYSVSLRVTDSSSQTSTTTASIAITNVAPTLTLTGNNSVAEGSTYSLSLSATDPGVDTISSWLINWGDGQTSTLSASSGTVTHVYADDGARTITATATDEDGSYSTTKAITVTNVAPTLTLTGNNTVPEGSTYSLALSATDPGSDTISSWLVAWGDGQTSTLSAASGTVTHVYADNGSRTITVTATDEDGSYTATKTISVTNVPPTITLTGNSTVAEGSTYSLAFSATDPGTDTISSWLIAWGDGQTSTVAGAAGTATHVYADNGSRTITVTATDEDGSYSSTKAITVTNVAPTLTLTGNSTVAEGSSYSLALSATDPGTDTISSWLIAWGDGQTSTLAAASGTVSHVYADDGARTITVTATDEDGSYSATKSITVTNVAPTLTLAGSSTVAEGSTYSLALSAADPGADTISSWLIAWGDGQTSTLSAASGTVTHVYADNGSRTITVTATDEDGSYSATKSITVTNVAPTLTLTGDAAVDRNTPYSLTVSATDPGTDTISSWLIAWGDGQSSTLNAAGGTLSHTYTAAGSYTISATATDEDGSYTATKAVVVNLVSASLVVTGNGSVAEGSSYTLGLSSPDPITSWLINWGDGQTSPMSGSSGSLSHTYADDGPRTISIVASDGVNQFAASKLVVVTNVAPTLSLVGNASVNEGSSYSLSLSATDPGTDTVASWLINWGDGQTSTLNAASGSRSHVFADDGPRTIVVTATDEDGSYSASKSITINNVAPTLSLTVPSVAAIQQAVGVSFSATDPGNDTVSSWLIDWGDGAVQTFTGSATAASHTYSVAGNYTIALTATDEDGTFGPVTRGLTVSDVAGPSTTFMGSQQSGSSLTFAVQYQSGFGVSALGLTGNEISVLGPDGSARLVTLLSTSVTNDGVVATYGIVAPTAGWNWLDTGVYTASLKNGVVSDNGQNVFAGATLGVISADFDPADLAGNEFGTARSLGNLKIGKVNVAVDFTGVRDSNDFYSVNLLDRQTLDIKLYQNSENLDLYLYAADGTLVEESRRGGLSNERITFTLESGLYYIRVAHRGDIGSEYRLRLEGIAPPPRDLAGNDFSHAKDMGLFVGDASSSATDVVGTFDRYDVYRFAVDTANVFTLNLSGLSDNASLQLYRADGTLIASSDKPSTSDETIKANLLSGDYYARVAYTGSGSTTFKLDFNASTPPPVFTPTRDFGTPTPGSIAVATGDLGPTQTEGRYSFSVTDDQRVYVKLSDLTIKANLQIVDAFGNVVAESTRNGTATDSVNQVFAKGQYFIRVVYKDTKAGTFRLRVAGQ